MFICIGCGTGLRWVCINFVVEDNLGEELLVTVVILLITVVIMLRTLENEVVAPRPLIPRFSAIEKQRKVLLSVIVVCV